MSLEGAPPDLQFHWLAVSQGGPRDPAASHRKLAGIGLCGLPIAGMVDAMRLDRVGVHFDGEPLFLE